MPVSVCLKPWILVVGEEHCCVLDRCIVVINEHCWESAVALDNHRDNDLSTPVFCFPLQRAIPQTQKTARDPTNNNHGGKIRKNRSRKRFGEVHLLLRLKLCVCGLMSPPERCFRPHPPSQEPPRYPPATLWYPPGTPRPHP